MTSLFVLLAITAAGPAAAIKDIDGQCRSIHPAHAARAVEHRPRVFADVSAAVLPKPREGEWREFETETELRTFADRGRAPNTEAVVARAPDGTTLVSMYFQGPSADWAHVVDYCYRPTGTLARVRGTFNSYTAAASVGIRRRRTMYFDGGGGILLSKTQVSDLASDKPLPSVSFTDEEDPVYPALRALPFSPMLTSTSTSTSTPGAREDDPSAAVSRTIKEHLPAIRACSGKATLSGRIVARWTIDTSGAVTEFAWEDDRIGNRAFTACARKVIEHLPFPPPANGPAPVSFPLIFENGS